jgi:integrase
MGRERTMMSIDRNIIQDYVKARSVEGRKPYTIKKELKTLRMAWRWAINWGGFNVSQIGWEIKDLSFPRENGKPPFQTFDQITAKIGRGGIAPEKQKELWDSLFLRSEEIAELLQTVAKTDPLTHALVAFAALTGARRSELMRSQIEDIDLKQRSITIREKKRTRGDSYRTVDMHPILERLLSDHLANHPGGQFTFCNADLFPLTKDQFNDRFKRAVRNHEKFKRLKGWHVLRHSFISVLCQKGVDQRIISLYVGHQTKEMEERYRHLIPEPLARPIDKLLS